MIWDVIVIGGGPAGLMAAYSAREAGAQVLLLEKNRVLGRKLRITGKGPSPGGVQTVSVKRRGTAPPATIT